MGESNFGNYFCELDFNVPRAFKKLFPVISP